MSDENIQQDSEPAGEIETVSPQAAPAESALVTEHLQRLPNVIARGLIYIVVLFLFSAVIYAWVSHIDLVVSSRAVARPITRELRVLSDRLGHVEQVLVEEGDVVSPGDALFMIRSKEAIGYASKVEEIRKTIALKNDSFKTRRAGLADEISQIDLDHEKNGKIMRLKLDRNRLEKLSVESDAAYWNTEAEGLQAEFDSTEKLFREQLTSIAEYNSIKSRLDRARTELTKLSSRKDIIARDDDIILEELRAENAGYENSKRTVEKKLKNLDLEQQSAINSLESELKTNEAMLAMMEGREGGEESGKIFRAEIAGVVSDIRVRNAGDYIRQSDHLCTIVPTNTPLCMDITVMNKDVGFINVGTRVKYKVDAFPYRDYGMLRGRVSSISPAAGEAPEYTYRVIGDFDKDRFDIKGRWYPLKPGMTATAEMITERKSLMAIIFDKFRE